MIFLGHLCGTQHRIDSVFAQLRLVICGHGHNTKPRRVPETSQYICHCLWSQKTLLCACVYAWAGLFKQAGWTVRIEQLVPTRTDYKRADLSATSLLAKMSRMSWSLLLLTSASVAMTICTAKQALAKASQYGCGPGGLLPNGTRLIPAIHAGVVPFLDHYAMELFTRVSRQAALRRDPCSPAYWHPSLRDWTKAAAASFTVTMARAAYRMHAACGHLSFV